MNYIQMFRELLKEIGPGQMPSTAYDTAWLARLGEIDWEISNRALNWICENQLSDGSWGASELMYYHDRIICTLAAVTALTRQGRRARDRRQIERGQQALERMIGRATEGLKGDPNGATVGFEMIAPTLSGDAESLGIIRNQTDRILGRLSRQRKHKLGMLEGRKIDRSVTIAFSTEMAGADSVKLLDIDNLLEANGSVATSPSATAYFAAQMAPHRQDLCAHALRYLKENALDGGVPNVAPFDIFERSWTLWNLGLTEASDEETLDLCKPHLDFLQDDWVPGQGVTFAAKLPPKDSDDTSLTYDVLRQFNRHVDVEAVLSYEGERYYRCFALEANPSLSANIHVVSALRRAGYEAEHPSAQKTLTFLRQARTGNAFWFDKWHISPYYPTAHAIIACAGYDDETVKSSVEWLLATQHSNGSWGHYMPTAEETAYSLQALVMWERSGKQVPKDIVRRGAEWLSDHLELPKPPLWIGKCLYCPELVIRSAILSALILTI